MTPDGWAEPNDISLRDKRVLAGLYLSKYNADGLRMLGFSSFKEAYNVIGYALGGGPQSIKNYRDEFDPLFPNARKGWRKRDTREYCLKVFDQFHNIELEPFTTLVKSLLAPSGSLLSSSEMPSAPDDSSSSFAQRLITGLAAERYFEAIHTTLPEFNGCALEIRPNMAADMTFGSAPIMGRARISSL